MRGQSSPADISRVHDLRSVERPLCGTGTSSVRRGGGGGLHGCLISKFGQKEMG